MFFYSILSLRYIRIGAFFLNLLGAWPNELFGGKTNRILTFHRKILPVQLFLGVFGIGYYLINHYGNISFFVAGHVSITGSIGFILFVSAIPYLINYRLYFFTKLSGWIGSGKAYSI